MAVLVVTFVPMDISREDLTHQYHQLSDGELVNIYRRRDGYTALAKEVLVEEMRLRNLSGEEEDIPIADQMPGDAETTTPENAGKLIFAEKLVAYFCFPIVLLGLVLLIFLVDARFREQYQQKVNKAFFFLIYSIVIFVVLAVLDSFSIMNWRTELWAIGFLIPFLISLRPPRERVPEPQIIEGEKEEDP